jgi:starch phosphorylase
MTESMPQANLSARAFGDRNEGEVAHLRKLVLERLLSTTGKDQTSASQRDWLIATAFVVRDRIIKAWIASKKTNYEEGRRQVYYLSLEFLIGRLLRDALNNLDLTEEMRQALAGLDVDLDKLSEMEPDAALGNGGLGRLAACFMESMATLEVAAYGYGIRYDHGLFRQAIKDGWQHEYPEDWLAFGDPWEFPRPESPMPSVLAARWNRSTTARSRRSGARRKLSRPLPTTRRSPAGAANM